MNEAGGMETGNWAIRGGSGSFCEGTGYDVSFLEVRGYEEEWC